MILTIERLNRVAGAEVAETVASRLRAVLMLFSLVSIRFAVVSGASWNESIAVRALAVAVTVSTVTLWCRWRYSLYACAVILFAVGVGAAIFGHYSETFWGWTSRLTYPASAIETDGILP
jgi:hypothetical protein